MTAQSSSCGSISNLVRLVADGNQTAVARLWSRVASRLLRKADRVIRWAAIWSHDRDDLANSAFGNVVTWLDKKNRYANRKRLWYMLDNATYQRGIRVKQSNDKHYFSDLDESIECSRSYNIEHELNEELAELDLIDSDYSRIASLMIKGYKIREISRITDIPERTLHRKVASLRSAVKQRLEVSE